MKRTILIFALLSLAWATPAGAATDKTPCDQVRDLRIAGEYSQTIKAAGRCLEERPGDVELQLEMARALSAKDRLDEARDWTHRALEQAPQHTGAVLLNARLLARKSQFDAAWQQLENLDDDTRQSTEIRRFEADLTLWQGNYVEAIDRYTSYLEGRDDSQARTNLGHAQRRAGRQEAAEKSYRQACDQNVDPACRALDDLRGQRAPRYFARVEPGYSLVSERPNGQRLRLAVGTEPTPETGIEVGYHLIRRGFLDDSLLQDMGLSLAARWASDTGPRAGIGGGWTFEPDFSPQWNAYLEAGWVGGGFDAGLRGWRIQFPTAGATVVTPSLAFYTGPWMFDARYYLGIDDAGDVDHSAIGRVGYFFGDRTSIHIGGGIGNRPDYVELSPLSDVPTISHYTALLGGDLELGDHHLLSLDLQYRHEGGFGSQSSSASETYRAFEMVLGYTLYVW